MYSRIYVDTAPIIYFLENNPLYALKVQRFILSNATAGSEFVTSVITNIEYLPKPMAEQKQDLVLAYNRLKTLLNITMPNVTDDISTLAVKVRVKYPAIKPLDSIHLATAIHTGCDAFLTNDSQLKQVTEIPVVYVGDL